MGDQTAALPKDVQLKAWARRYLDTVNLNDPAAMADLYRPDGEIEDPVGSGAIVRGREEIRAFYEGAFSVPVRVELEGVPRGSYGSEAAYMFRVTRGADRLNVIGVLAFDEAGLIRSMRGFHGPSDRNAVL